MDNHETAQEIVFSAAVVVLMMWMTNTLEPSVRWIMEWFL